MDSLLECTICLGPFTDPRTLPCLHTLCLKCLNGVISTSNVADTGEFHCPVCRIPITIPPNLGQGFPKNFFLNTYIGNEGLDATNKTARVQTTYQAPKDTVCACSDDGEDHGKPVKFCTECAEFYCSKCSKFHFTLKATRSHEQVPSEKVTKEMIRIACCSSEYPTCVKHKGQKMEVYCSTCRIPVCPVCCHATHEGHTFRQVSDVDSEIITELSETEQKISDLNGCLRKQDAGVEAARSQLAANSEGAKCRLHAVIEELNLLLEQNAKKAAQRIDDFYADKEKEIDATSKSISLSTEMLDSLHTFVQDLQKEGNTVSRMASLEEVRKRLQHFQTSVEEMETKHNTLTKIPSEVVLAGDQLKDLEMERKLIVDQGQPDVFLTVTIKSAVGKLYCQLIFSVSNDRIKELRKLTVKNIMTFDTENSEITCLIFQK